MRLSTSMLQCQDQAVDCTCNSLLQEYVDISNTRMACCTTQEEADKANGGLPSFLQFSKRYQQVMHTFLTSHG